MASFLTCGGFSVSQFNRRTLVRGAAWSIPVVAVAAHAPAFATSTDAPAPHSMEMTCRTVGNGQGNCHGYRLVLTFQVQGPYTWNVSILPSQITFTGGAALEIKTPTTFPYQISPSVNTMRLWFCKSTNSADFLNNLTIRYTVQRADLPDSPTQTLSFGPESFSSITSTCPTWN